jgi:hypothetical protein
MNIQQYTRFKSKDNKRLFIVLGKWMKNFEITGYEVLDVNAEQCVNLPYATFHSQIETGNLVQINHQLQP